MPEVSHFPDGRLAGERVEGRGGHIADSHEALALIR